MGYGDRPLKVSESAADRMLCQLAADVATVWRKHTGAELPSLPSSKSPPETSWRAIRKLQQHPMWIVFDALGIFADADAINGLARKVAKLGRGQVARSDLATAGRRVRSELLKRKRVRGSERSRRRKVATVR